MTRLTNTTLFKSTLPEHITITKKQLAKELAIVKKNGNAILWDQRQLIAAFLWDTTPQGDQFWRNVDKLYYPK